eukprot:COSAG04_NODE_108_length_25934_cov_13.184014_10_plen_265_part_00
MRAVLLVSSLILAVPAHACTSHYQCSAGTYCDVNHDCYDCGYITRGNTCDALNGDCSRCHSAGSGTLPQTVTISGVPYYDYPAYNGVYVQTGDRCNGKPVWRQPNGNHHYVLFQPHGKNYWMAGHNSRRWDCHHTGHLSSSAGNCPDDPTGAGCAGEWKYFDGRGRHVWLHSEAIRVTAGGSAGWFSSLVFVPTSKESVSPVVLGSVAGLLGTLVAAAMIVRRRRRAHTPLAGSEAEVAEPDDEAGSSSEEEADGERTKLSDAV